MSTLIMRGCIIASIVLVSLACNPECESFPANNVIVPQGPYQAGTELMIASNPSNFLEGRKILMSTGSPSSEVIELRSSFEETLGAAIVRIPEEVSNNATFLIDDPDCSGQFIPIGSTTNIVDETFFVDNPFFITPTPPLIIIPTIPPSPPPLVVDAWFSPNNRDYCIWFRPDLDEFGNEKSNLIPAIAVSPTEITNGPPNGSAELSANCTPMTSPSTDRLYHANPVSGFIDKENNFIKIQIDRTAKGLGVEEFVGQFVDPAQLPDPDYRMGGICSPDVAKSSQPNIMFLTSQQTGRQLILFRGKDEG